MRVGVGVGALTASHSSELDRRPGAAPGRLTWLGSGSGLGLGSGSGLGLVRVRVRLRLRLRLRLRVRGRVS